MKIVNKKMIILHGRNSYQCSVCNEQFPTKENVESHVVTEHQTEMLAGEGKSDSCPWISFVTWGLLLQMMMMIIMMKLVVMKMNQIQIIAMPDPDIKDVLMQHLLDQEGQY